MRGDIGGLGGLGEDVLIYRAFTKEGFLHDSATIARAVSERHNSSLSKTEGRRLSQRVVGLEVATRS